MGQLLVRILRNVLDGQVRDCEEERSGSVRMLAATKAYSILEGNTISFYHCIKQMLTHSSADHNDQPRNNNCRKYPSNQTFHNCLYCSFLLSAKLPNLGASGYTTSGTNGPPQGFAPSHSPSGAH